MLRNTKSLNGLQKTLDDRQSDLLTGIHPVPYTGKVQVDLVLTD